MWADCVDRRDSCVDRYGGATGNHGNWWDWHVARYGGATGNHVNHAGEPFSAIRCHGRVSLVNIRGGWYW